MLAGRAGGAEAAAPDVSHAAQALAADGYRTLAIYKQRTPTPGLPVVVSALGAPVAEDAELVVFRLRPQS